MGNEQSQEGDISQYHSHDRIGIYRFLSHHEDSCVQLQRALPSESMYLQWAEGVRRVKLSMVSSDTVYLPVQHNFERTQICGSGGKVTMLFEEWDNFLKQEIANRRKNQDEYSQEQIWLIFYSLVKVGVIYEGRNQKIGDLHPNNVILTGQGLVKVITTDSLPLQQTNFQKIVQEIKADVYLAPEEMQPDMLESAVYSVPDPSKADVFSLGVTMLEAITLQNCSYLYIRNPLRLSFDKMTTLTNSMKDKYSELLYNTLLSTLAIHPHQRKSFLQLYEMLRPHQQLILDLKPFSLNASNVQRDQPSIHGNNNGSRVGKGSIMRVGISGSRVSMQREGKGSNGSRGKFNVPFSPASQEYLSFVKHH